MIRDSTAALCSPKLLRALWIGQDYPESGLGPYLLPAGFREKNCCCCYCMPLLPAAAANRYSRCCCSCCCTSRTTATACSVLLLQVSVLLAAVLLLQALRQTSTAATERCRKQALLHKQALLQASAAASERATLCKRCCCCCCCCCCCKREHPCHHAPSWERGRRKRKKAIFSLWWRCLHSECRGAEGRPHFCLLVLGAADCFCSLHDFCSAHLALKVLPLLHVCFFKHKHPIFCFFSVSDYAHAGRFSIMIILPTNILDIQLLCADTLIIGTRY